MAGRTSKAKQVFVTHYDRLQKAIISPRDLAPLLAAKQLIGEGTKSDVASTPGASSRTKATWILEEVQAGFGGSSQQDADFLKVFCEVLEEDGTPALVRIAANMRSSLDGEVKESLPPPPS